MLEYVVHHGGGVQGFLADILAEASPGNHLILMQCGKRSAEGHVLAEAPLGRHLVGRQIGEGEGKERLLRQPLLCLEDDRGRESVFSQRGSGTLMVEAAAVTAGEAAVAPTKAVGKVVAMCVVVGIVGIGGDVVIVIVVVLVVVVDLFEVCVGGESWFGLRRRAFVSSGAVEQSGVGLPGELFAEASQFFYFYIHSVTVFNRRRWITSYHRVKFTSTLSKPVISLFYVLLPRTRLKRGS